MKAPQNESVSVRLNMSWWEQRAKQKQALPVHSLPGGTQPLKPTRSDNHLNSPNISLNDIHTHACIETLTHCYLLCNGREEELKKLPQFINSKRLKYVRPRKLCHHNASPLHNIVYFLKKLEWIFFCWIITTPILKMLQLYVKCKEKPNAMNYRFFPSKMVQCCSLKFPYVLHCEVSPLLLRTGCKHLATEETSWSSVKKWMML